MSNAGVLITRPAAQGMKTAQAITDLGLTPFFCPMLEIVPLSHDVKSTSCDALLLTSINAAQNFDLSRFLKDTLIFCVGQSLAAHLKEIGFANIVSAPAALDLADLMMKSDAQHLLYLRGQEITCDFATLMPRKKVDEVIVYKADQITEIAPDVLEELKAARISYALFYSARSAQSFAAALEKAGEMARAGGIKALCLSPSVLESVSVLPWKDSLSATRPTEEALIELLAEATHD